MKKPLYSIPAGLPFADNLARWILEGYGADPLQLPRLLVLLPSRRACLSLREAFLRESGGRPILLPRMQPLGEVDEDRLLNLPEMVEMTSLDMPHPAFASKRLFLLARLVRGFVKNTQGRNERMDHAVAQARDIADLLDKVEREGASLANLGELAPENFAVHWQLTTEFLAILAEHWPQLAADEKLTSPEYWRNRSLQALASAWERQVPDYPVIAAGTTGSIASTATLLKVILQLPHGAVVLPGLDTKSSDDYMEHISESHAQWGMRELLATLGTTREEVQLIGEKDAKSEARLALLSRALAPAEMLEEWRDSKLANNAVEGLAFLPCADQQEEALAIALSLRETLETEGKTAALVTHDRTLARRVSAEMRRFGIEIDDSAGQPLSGTPAVAFLRLVLEMGETNAGPVALLALLKHPFTHAGMERVACLEASRELELRVLRGICPSFGLAGLQAEASRCKNADAMLPLLSNLANQAGDLLALFSRGGMVEFSEMLEAHIACAHKLAGDILWQGREAETLTSFLGELRDAGDEASLIEVDAYAALFDTLLAGKVVRTEFGTHPRLKILSPIEARMQSFDRIIIGGMNEGSWPQQVGADPWFNRPMRSAMGLSLPERQIGQAAHDFMMLASAPDVLITRAQKVDGSPTSPARWLVRLLTLLEHYGVREQLQPSYYTQWARALDAAAEVTPCKRPQFAPPLAARPDVVAVTQVERWLGDPYAFYAAKVLQLRALEPINKDPGPADFGNTVHAALQAFAERFPNHLPVDAIDQLLQCGMKVLEEYKFYPVASGWWWPRFERIAGWMIEREKLLRPSLSQVWAEIKGSFELEGVTFTGRADRIEQEKSGGLAIVDYKTGSAHSKADTREGRAVQLMLLALVAQEGKWEHASISSKTVSRLEYWIAGGGRVNGEIRPVDASQIAEYAKDAKAMLAKLVAEYRNPEKPYISAVSSGSYNDYEHLARVQEWR